MVTCSRVKACSMNGRRLTDGAANTGGPGTFGITGWPGLRPSGWRSLAKASSDRLYVAWRLSLYGLRRGEVLGLRWSDVDLRAGTLTVNQARVLVEYRVRIEEPKSRNGKRTLPLDGELVAALTELRKRQLEESTIAGAAYRSGLAELFWYQGGEYVITDEGGSPVHPEWYSDEFGRLLRRAGLRRITSHDSRHTTLTLMGCCTPLLYRMTVARELVWPLRPEAN